MAVSRPASEKVRRSALLSPCSRPQHLLRWGFGYGSEHPDGVVGDDTQDSALIEAFNSRFRQECLNEHWFLSLADSQEKIDAWQNHYNAERPHSALGNLAPEAFARTSTATAAAVRGKTELAVLT